MCNITGISMTNWKTAITMNRIFFTSDLHFGDRSLLKYLKHRPYAADATTYGHDRWLFELWTGTVDRSDTIYILGDVCSFSKQHARELLESLPGKKVLVWGNHDSNLQDCRDCFMTCGQLFEKKIGRSQGVGFPIRLAMCHYPLLTWKAKPKGAVMIHGHSHGRLDAVNGMCPDLRWDIGIDSSLSRKIGERNGTGFALVDLESLVCAVVEKAGGQDIRGYVRKTYLQADPPELFSVMQV